MDFSRFHAPSDPPPQWQQRHNWILGLLAFHAVGLFLFGTWMGAGIWPSAWEAAVVAGFGAVAAVPGLHPRLRGIVASLGLVSASAILIHLSGGYIEAHFHFFVVLGIIILYRDWIPLVSASLYVLIHHGLVGTIDPTSVYNHPAAIASPWAWSAIHSAFVLALGIALLINWRSTERADLLRSEAEAQRLRESENYRSIIEHSTNLFYRHTPEQVLTYVSPQSEHFLGVSPDEAMKRWTEFATDHPMNETGLQNTLRALKTGERQPPYELELQRVDGTRLRVEVREAPIIEAGKVAGIVGSLTDVTQRTRMEQQFRGLLESAPDAMVIVDEKGTIVRVNTQAERLFEYDRAEMLGQKVEVLIPGRLAGAHPGHRDRYFDDPQVRPMGAGLDLWGVRKGGEEFPVEISLSPLETESGVLVTAAVRDMTERQRQDQALRRSLHQKEALLKEVHHRVKNNLQVVSSLLNLQESMIQDRGVAQMLRDSRNRIRSMAMVHEKLYRSEDVGRVSAEEYFGALMDGLRSSYPDNRVRLHLELENIDLDLDTAVNCGIILNELFSNSLKHAFPDGPGNVTVRFGRRNELLELAVQDDGIGLPKDFSPEGTESLGMRLVQMLTKQLKGNLSWNRDRGAAFTVSFPYTGES